MNSVTNSNRKPWGYVMVLWCIIGVLSLSDALPYYFSDVLGKNNFYYHPEDCWAYGYDNSKMHILPVGVLLPENSSQIHKIIKFCYVEQLPISGSFWTNSKAEKLPKEERLYIRLSGNEALTSLAVKKISEKFK